MEEENLVFTEITENEKRIINLIRAFIIPYKPIQHFIDELVDGIVHETMSKAISMLAFTEVLQHERDNKDLSNIQLMARINKYREHLEQDKETNSRLINGIFSDIVTKLEGDILPIQTYSKKDNLEEEEKALDKIQEI